MRSFRAFIIIAAAGTVTGCQTAKTVTVTEIVERRIEVPKTLLTCTEEPTAGTVWVTQKDVAKYLVKLAEAGEDCRLKLAAVKRLVDAR
jgi:predicted secreted protein